VTRTTEELSKLDDDELRLVARSRGLPVGRTLTRDQLLELLSEPPDETDDHEMRSGEADDGGADLPSRLSTVTMAKLFARQGLDREAAEVCRAVLARQPLEERARRLLERLAQPSPEIGDSGVLTTPRQHRFSARASFAGVSPPAPPLPSSSGGSTLVVLPRSPTMVFAFWEAEAELDRRARERAGPGAQRVLRVFSAWRGDARIERRTRDEAVEDRVGELFLSSCQPGSNLRVALGWLQLDGRLVPVCHSSATRTPVQRASRRRGALWGRLRPSRPVSRSTEAALRLATKLRDALPMALPWESGDGASIDWPPPSPPPDEEEVEIADIPSSAALHSR